MRRKTAVMIPMVKRKLKFSGRIGQSIACGYIGTWMYLGPSRPGAGSTVTPQNACLRSVGDNFKICAVQ
jgi:hypothetical protein